MPPVSKRILSPKVSKNIYELLIKSFSKTDKNSELMPFISDLLTPTEQIMISKRLAIAFLLYRGDCDQRRIGQTLKVSTCTVCKVNQVLNTHGAGYRNVLKKILRDENLMIILNGIFETFSPLSGVNIESKKSFRRYKKREQKLF